MLAITNCKVLTGFDLVCHSCLPAKLSYIDMTQSAAPTVTEPAKLD